MQCTRLWMRGCALLIAGLGACSADSDSQHERLTPGGPSTTAGPSTVAAAGTTGDPWRDASFGNPTVDGGVLGSAGAGATQKPCGAMPCIDTSMRVPDDDGFTVAEGDCDDFAPLVNPGAFDVPNNGIDDDCQGGDATTDSCDDALELGSTDALAAARAIELCPATDDKSKRWGVISARWTSPDGLGDPANPLMHGLLPGFGPGFTPRAGKTVLAISSGVARAPGQAGFTADCSDRFPATSNTFPKGFKGTSSSCPADAQATMIVDAVALEVRVRMPTNASALRFDSAFFTDEYPDFICTPFNDFFQVLVDPMRTGGSADGNVVFDVDGNAVSVNNSLLRACTPGTFGGKMFGCPLGFEPIKGTGYENCSETMTGPGGVFGGGVFGGGLFGGGSMDNNPAYGASTGWLSTEFAVKPGEVVTLRFTIWDSGDSALDSLSLVDHVRFRLSDKPPPPDKPMTQPMGPD